MTVKVMGWTVKTETGDLSWRYFSIFRHDVEKAIAEEDHIPNGTLENPSPPYDPAFHEALQRDLDALGWSIVRCEMTLVELLPANKSAAIAPKTSNAAGHQKRDSRETTGTIREGERDVR